MLPPRNSSFTRRMAWWIPTWEYEKKVERETTLTSGFAGLFTLSYALLLVVPLQVQASYHIPMVWRALLYYLSVQTKIMAVLRILKAWLEIHIIYTVHKTNSPWSLAAGSNWWKCGKHIAQPLAMQRCAHQREGYPSSQRVIDSKRTPGRGRLCWATRQKTILHFPFGKTKQNTHARRHFWYNISIERFEISI